MPRILVVDDEPDFVRVVVRTLAGHGYVVDTARDGEETIARVKADPPDVLLVDLHLPGMNGFDVCHHLKSDEATRHVPILMMTASRVSIAEIHGAGSTGPDEYVTKPFMNETLLANVARLLAPR